MSTDMSEIVDDGLIKVLTMALVNYGSRRTSAALAYALPLEAMNCS